MRPDMSEEEYKQAINALRAERKDLIEKARMRVKDHNAIFKKIKSAMAVGALTVPEISSAIDVPKESVFWHLTALKTYGQIEESTKEGDYFRYRLVSDTTNGD